jgi:hypothetical protein
MPTKSVAGPLGCHWMSCFNELFLNIVFGEKEKTKEKEKKMGASS